VFRQGAATQAMPGLCQGAATKYKLQTLKARREGKYDAIFGEKFYQFSLG